jgi:endo-1,4-beta-xylanase
MDSLTTMLDDFIERKIPIDGVGFQLHIFNDYPSANVLEAAFKKIADKNLKVKITEMDILYNNPYSDAYKAGNIQLTFTNEVALKQKKRYCEVIAAYLNAVPAPLRGGITSWGVWDANSWLVTGGRVDWPLLFDANFHAKPALRGVADALTNQACTDM